VTFTPTADQRRAIEAEPGPVLVVAGPGAGKTHCLIARVHHLVTVRGYQPERICAVTFTNKAADEISARLEREIGDAGRHVTRGTLHRLCLEILRDYPEPAGLRPGFGIADEEYQHALLRRLRVPEDRHGPLLNLFSRHRLQQTRLSQSDEALLAEYAGFLRRRNLLDFDDIILRTHQLLLDHPEVRARVASGWDALLVDEFQDLSATNYAVIRLLGESHRHVFAVGDDEQSIYGWAGADPEVLAAFRRDFRIADLVVLEQNHRTARHIFEAARRILRANPRLFDKDLRASRESSFPVEAVAFRTDRAEAAWIAADIGRDREEHGLAWGDVGILYRQHRTGNLLERTLLEAGIPIRMARGRTLSEDPIIAEVLGALRILADPDDPVPVEALALAVLPPHLLQRVVAEFGAEPGLLTSLRLFHRLQRGDELDRKAAMRFVYHVENLPALHRASATLGDLVDALLAARPGTRRSQLEERSDELTDPRDIPEVPELCAALARVRDDGGRIHLAVVPGLEVALAGMLRAAGFAGSLEPAAAGVAGSPPDLVLEGDPGRLPLRLFRALQLLVSRRPDRGVTDCVTFDLETTDNEVEACGIIEIGAARVRNGIVVETFTSLVRPDRTIAAGAAAQHGYADADVASAPPFDEIWPRFREFLGGDLLVAHNGLAFDLPVLRRHVEALGLSLGHLPVLDTLPMARSVFRTGAGLQSLAQRFGVDPGTAHHALDDAITLARVLEGLAAARAARSRKAAFQQGLDWLGLALAIAPPDPADPEAVVIRDVARWFTMSRFSEVLTEYGEAAPDIRGAPTLDEVIERLGGRSLLHRVRRQKTAEQRYPVSVARLRNVLSLVTAQSVDEGIRQLLEIAALSRHDGPDTDRSRVSLLTLHATKGLEFSRVYIAGVEDYQLPGYHAITKRLEDDFPEARRTLYVGMTRARDRLVLTRADERGGKPSGGSRFLEELELVAHRPGAPDPVGVA
jgi:DNA polymerase III epsilon subunit family exonuclease